MITGEDINQVDAKARTALLKIDHRMEEARRRISVARADLPDESSSGT
jgi:hypothetical protein